MSVSGNSDYIEQYGMTGEAYSALIDSEQVAVNDAYVTTLKEQGKSDEEIAEALSELKADLEAIQEMYEEYIDELEDLQRGDLSDDEEAKIDDLVDSCTAIINEAEEAEDKVDDSYDNYTEHNKTYGTGENASITDLTLDGETYTYEMNGGDVFISTDVAYHWSAEEYNDETGVYKFKVEDENGNYSYVEFKTNNVESPFGDDSTADADYLTEEGVTNEQGEVTSDYNADGFMNQDDIDAALKDRDGSTLEDATTNFYFSSGITSDDLDAMKSWSEGLLKVSYWGDSTTSFYEELFGEDEDASGNLSVIAGYDDALSGLSAVSATTDGSLGDLQDEAELALETLFGYINDPSAGSITDVWADIFAQWSGLSDADKALLIQHLTLTVATNAKEQFSTLFGSVAMTLENMLDYESDSHPNYTANDKTVVLLLENLTAGGNYGGSSAVWTKVFSADGTKDGEWSNNEENVEAIQQYMEIISLMGGVPTGYESDAIEREEALIAGEKDTEEAGGTVTDDIWNYSSVYGQVGNYGDTYANDMDWTDGVDDQILTNNLTTLVNGIDNLLSDGEATVEEIVSFIISTIGSLGAAQQDDTATALCALLHDKAPNLFNKLKANEDFVGYMDGLINNRNNNPHNYEQVRQWLGLSGKN